MKNKFIYTTALMTFLMFVSCGENTINKKMPGMNDPVSVKIISLKKSNTLTQIQASGQFTTNDETFLSFKTGGIIQKIYVKEGENVQRGQLLATLDMTELNAMVNQASIAFEKANRDLKRTQQLYKDSVATLEQFQNTQSAFDLAKEQLVAARFNLEHAQIRATQNGVILKKLANMGQIVAPGTPILETSGKGNSNWILRVALSDRDWAMIKKGDSALVEVEALDMHKMKALVDSKAENIDPMTGSFSIDIMLLNAEHINIASGMFGKVTLLPKITSPNWKIPYQAVLDGHADKGFVFVTNDNKTAQKVAVTIKDITSEHVLVSDGLQNYASLIVAGSAYLTHNSKITIVH